MALAVGQLVRLVDVPGSIWDRKTRTWRSLTGTLGRITQVFSPSVSKDGSAFVELYRLHRRTGKPLALQSEMYKAREIQVISAPTPEETALAELFRPLSEAKREAVLRARQRSQEWRDQMAAICELAEQQREEEAKRTRPLRVALVGCGAKKRAWPAPASDLYTGALFTAARAYAKAHADEWWILSAQHGVVAPDEVLEPYERRLASLTEAERAEWADGVSGFLSLHYRDRPVEYIGLAGADYLDGLRLNGPLSQPLAGMGIGDRVRYLRDALTDESRAAENLALARQARADPTKEPSVSLVDWLGRWKQTRNTDHRRRLKPQANRYRRLDAALTDALIGSAGPDELAELHAIVRHGALVGMDSERRQHLYDQIERRRQRLRRDGGEQAMGTGSRGEDRVLAEVRGLLVDQAGTPELRSAVATWFANNTDLLSLVARTVAERMPAKAQEPSRDSALQYSLRDNDGIELDASEGSHEDMMGEEATIREWTTLNDRQVGVLRELPDDGLRDTLLTPAGRWSDVGEDAMSEMGLDIASTYFDRFLMGLALTLCPDLDLVSRLPWPLVDALAHSAAHYVYSLRTAGWDVREPLALALSDLLFALRRRVPYRLADYDTPKRRALELDDLLSQRTAAVLQRRPVATILFAALHTLFEHPNVASGTVWVRIARFVGNRAAHNPIGQGFLANVKPDTLASVLAEAIAKELPELAVFVEDELANREEQ